MLVGQTHVASRRSWRGLRAFPLSTCSNPFDQRDTALTQFQHSFSSSQTYFPLTDANTAACEASGNGAYCDDATYGLSFGRKNFYWNSGSWNTVQERVKLNTPGKQDGAFLFPPFFGVSGR